MKKINAIIIILILALTTTTIIAYSNEGLSIESDFDPLHADNGIGQGICVDPDVYPSEYKTNVLGVKIK